MLFESRDVSRRDVNEHIANSVIFYEDATQFKVHQVELSK